VISDIIHIIGIIGESYIKTIYFFGYIKLTRFNRNHAELTNAAGLYVYSLQYDVFIEGNSSFTQLIAAFTSASENIAEDFKELLLQSSS